MLRKFLLRSNPAMNGKTLEHVVSELEKFADPKIADSWDNVGLLIEPHKPRMIQKIILTIDLTTEVLEEAIEKKTDMIISYHPPIFAPLTRITKSTWKGRIIAACLSENIAVYSPHTTWDIVKGGLTDWLASALPFKEILPIKTTPEKQEYQGGDGRYVTLSPTLAINDIITLLHKHVEADIHLALAKIHTEDTKIKTAAVCAGSGASILRGVAADLFITGEMSHHEILHANETGITVMLCNHTNSERGFLKEFMPVLYNILGGECDIGLAETDKDPLKTFPKGVCHENV